ncbi:MAG: hypothetical protein ABH891_02780 [Candidatus Omnitrophota bacterium]
MKKVFFVSCVLAFILIGFVWFTGEVSGKYTPPVKLPGEILVGKVDSISVRDTSQGKIQQMTIRDRDGIQIVFVLAPDATVTGKDGNPISLSWIKGNKVSIRYVIASDGFTQTIKSVQVL